MGSKKSSPPPRESTLEAARGQLQAQLETSPQAAQLAFDILSSPEFGLQPTTALRERVRTEEFPEETAVRSQLLQNILSNLQAPTGISPEQQAAIDARRGRAQEELQQALRQRAELGGGLFGGRAGRTEERAVSEFQQAAAEEDIAREERARLNAIQAAIPALQILFPQAAIQAPQFQPAAASANAALQAAVSQRGQDISLQQALAQQRASQLGSLFGGLGQLGGGALGGFLSRPPAVGGG